MNTVKPSNFFKLLVDLIVTYESEELIFSQILNMDKGFEQVIFDFNTKARNVFFSLFDKFRESASMLDRQKDENVFQQQLGKYQRTLKEQLEVIAKELIDKNRSTPGISRFNIILSEKIGYFLNEFKLKSASV